METSRLDLQTEKFLSAPDSANAPDRFMRQLKSEQPSAAIISTK